MRKIGLFILIFTCCLVTGYGHAETKDIKEGYAIEVPPGMELIQNKDNVFIIVPKDSKTQEEGNFKRFEGTSAYMSRKLGELEERLSNLEIEQKKLKSKVEQLNKTLGR